MVAQRETQTERRVWGQTIEVRAQGADQPTRTLIGYAALFNRPTTIGTGKLRFVERVAPGAFSRSIQEADVRLLVNHDPNHVLARTQNGTLRLQEDELGLRVEADLDPTDPEAALWIARIERGLVNQMSFAFDVVKDEWNLEVDPPERTLQDVWLWDVSVVTFPAYVETMVSVRMADDVREALEQRGVVPPDVSDKLAPEDTPWQAPTLSDFTDKAWDELTVTEKRRIAGHFAWAAQMPPDRFTDLKLPHHRPSDGAVVWRGVAAAMAALFGARGGVDIPSADRRKVYEHLAQHYRQFDREPPEFKQTTWFPAPRSDEPEAENETEERVRLKLLRLRYEVMAKLLQ